MVRTKDNKTLRLVGIVLLFTLISACLMSGTMAKYITQGDGSDSARVALWGVVIESEGGLFMETYEKDDLLFPGTNSVISMGGNVVAPGTSGTAGAFAISGTPQVASRVIVEVKSVASQLNGWIVAGSAYEPVLWTLTGPNGAIATDVSFAALITAMNGIDAYFEAGEDLSTAVGAYTISWNWPFSTSTANDIKDTELGDAGTATITLVFDITVVQVD